MKKLVVITCLFVKLLASEGELPQELLIPGLPKELTGEIMKYNDPIDYGNWVAKVASLNKTSMQAIEKAKEAIVEFMSKRYGLDPMVAYGLIPLKSFKAEFDRLLADNPQKALILMLNQLIGYAQDSQAFKAYVQKLLDRNALFMLKEYAKLSDVTFRVLGESLRINNTTSAIDFAASAVLTVGDHVYVAGVNENRDIVLKKYDKNGKEVGTAIVVSVSEVSKNFNPLMIAQNPDSGAFVIVSEEADPSNTKPKKSILGFDSYNTTGRIMILVLSKDGKELSRFYLNERLPKMTESRRYILNKMGLYKF